MSLVEIKYIDCSCVAKCNNPIGLRGMSLSGAHRYKRVCICNGILIDRLHSTSIKIQGYTGTKYTWTSTKFCIRKEEEKGNRTKGREASLI